MDGINTLNSTPDAKSTGSGFIQQINRISEQEAIDQGYTVIKTAQDLDNIRNNVDADGNIVGKYILMNDIDLSSYSNWDPIGDADSGVGFTGTLDGNGYTISNLTINRPDEDYVGFFTLIGDMNTMTGGEVMNLGFDNVNIVGISSGGLASCIFFGATISNCYVIGKVEGISSVGGVVGISYGNISNSYVDGNVSGDYVTGGLVGLNIGTISGCYTSADVEGDEITGGFAGTNSLTITNSFSTGDVTGNKQTGGFVGVIEDGNIYNSYATCNVSGTQMVGGFTGYSLRGTVSNCFSVGCVQGVSDTGGLVGYNERATLENSIWNTEITGQSNLYGSDDGNGIFTNNKGLTTAEMQDPANWQGWDDTVWDFSTYPPKLKWQTQSSSNPGGDSDADDPNTPGGGDMPIPGAVRLQIGSDSSSTSAIYVDTSFDLGAFDVDFSSADSCAAAIEDIDEVLSRINTKRSEFGAVINRLSSILESQTTTIQNFTSAKSTIMDADIANESADFVKNQILQQTSSALLAQSQNLHASIVLSLIG